MKKMIFALAVLVTMVATASVFANEKTEECAGHHHVVFATQATSQGAHCRGTVGCGCPGFAPITNGDVWQQAYCKHCGHKRDYHR